MKGAAFGWPTKPPDAAAELRPVDWPPPAATIAGIDLEINSGELVLISGPVA